MGQCYTRGELNHIKRKSVGFFFQATHWNHGAQANMIRNAKNPPVTQEFWTNEFNRKLKEEFNVNNDFKSIFIDTFYHQKNENERLKFEENIRALMDFSRSRKPFHCEFLLY